PRARVAPLLPARTAGSSRAASANPLGGFHGKRQCSPSTHQRRHSTGAAEPDSRPTQAPSVLLGLQLRPINLGRAASGFVARLGPVLEPPQLIVSVHARSGWQLGYAVVDRPVPGETIGGMTVS